MVAITSSDSGMGMDLGWVNILGSLITLVQQTVNDSNGVDVTSQAISWPNSIAHGDLCVVAVQCDNDTATVTGPVGWTQAVSNPAGSAATQNVSLWYLMVPASVSGTTSTWHVSPASVLNISGTQWHAKNGWLASPLDATAQGNFGTNQGPTSAIDSGTSPWSAAATELWIAALGYAGQPQQETTVAGGFTEVSDNYALDVSLSLLAQIVSSKGYANCSYQLPTPADWAGVIATFMPFQGGSSEGGTGSESQFITVITGNRAVSSSDTGSGSETGTVPAVFQTPFSSDSGTGTDTQAGPFGVVASSWDYGNGMDVGVIPVLAYGWILPQNLFFNSILEGFSLDRVSVLGSNGIENARLYGAQSITLTPDVTTSELTADDDVEAVWYYLNKAEITVVNGFLSFAVIDQLMGPNINMASSGLSPHDYYGLPLWTQYQHNQPSVPLAFRMSSRSAYGVSRTLDFVLFKVQLSVLDFTGEVYKTGLGVSYAGTVFFSTTDEQGITLANPQVGRIVSSATQLTGAIGPVPF